MTIAVDLRRKTTKQTNKTNSLDPDQDRQNVCLDLDPKRLTLIVFPKDFFEKVNFEKSQQTTMKA